VVTTTPPKEVAQVRHAAIRETINGCDDGVILTDEIQGVLRLAKHYNCWVVIFREENKAYDVLNALVVDEV